MPRIFTRRAKGQPFSLRASLAKLGVTFVASAALLTVAVSGIGGAALASEASSVSASFAPAERAATPTSVGQGDNFVLGARSELALLSDGAGLTGTPAAAITGCDIAGQATCSGDYLSPEAVAARASNSKLLLLNRWRDATANFQNKYDMWAIGDLMNAASRTMIQGNIMAVGNGLWTVSQWVADLAINLEPINILGYQMDRVGATLGQAMLNPTSGVALIPLILVIVTLIWMFGSWRKAGPGGSSMLFKRMGGLVATIALFTVMVVGAQGSTTDAQGNYNPGVGSPGWLVTIANDSLSTAASVPVGAVLSVVRQQTTGELDNSLTTSTSGANLCGETVRYFDKRYVDSVGANALSTPQIALVQTMDSMWRTTGLQTWKTAQLGTSSYADASYCRLLEYWTQTPASAANSFKNATGIPASSNKDSGQLVWTAQGGEQVQRMMVGWAACEPADRASGSWKLRPGWDKLSGIAGDECAKWWGKKPTDKEFEGGFSVGYGMSDIDTKTENLTTNKDAVVDYLASLNGANAAGQVFPLIMYALSALVMMIVFFGMAIAVVIAKLFVVLGTITILPILILALFRSNGFEQLSGAAKQFIGSMMFAALALVLLSVVVLTTYIMVQFGNDAFGAGSVMALGWAGAAPVLSIVALNMVFKKVLKMPSPMSMKGAMAYGLASGAAGGAVGGFVGGRMMRSAAERAGRDAMRGAGSSALHKVSGGRMGTTAEQRNRRLGGNMLPDVRGTGRGTSTRRTAGGPETVPTGGGAPSEAPEGGAPLTKREQALALRESKRRERVEARVHAGQLHADNREHVFGSGFRGGSAEGPRGVGGFVRDKAASAALATVGGAALAWDATKRGATRFGNGVRTGVRTMAHPVKYMRGDDLRQQFTNADGTFREVDFRMARADRAKTVAKKAAVAGAVVAGGVMTGGSSWVIGAAAVGSAYATAKAVPTAWNATKRVGGAVSGRARMDTYRNYRRENPDAGGTPPLGGGGGGRPPQGGGGFGGGQPVGPAPMNQPSAPADNNFNEAGRPWWESDAPAGNSPVVPRTERPTPDQGRVEPSGNGPVVPRTERPVPDQGRVEPVGNGPVPATERPVPDQGRVEPVGNSPVVTRTERPVPDQGRVQPSGNGPVTPRRPRRTNLLSDNPDISPVQGAQPRGVPMTPPAAPRPGDGGAVGPAPWRNN